MRSGPHENDNTRLAGRLELVDEQEITTNVAFAMAGPVALEGVIEPFGRQRCIVRDQQYHCLLEPVEVVTA